MPKISQAILDQETEDTKYCPKCKKILPLYEYCARIAGRKMCCSWCISCMSNAGRERRTEITITNYKKLLKQQNGKCAICGTTIPGGRGLFHVDHDHKTKNKKDSVRGLLCMRCNHGLGKFRDNPEILAAAITYLLKARKKNG